MKLEYHSFHKVLNVDPIHSSDICTPFMGKGAIRKGHMTSFVADVQQYNDCLKVD